MKLLVLINQFYFIILILLNLKPDLTKINVEKEQKNDQLLEIAKLKHYKHLKQIQL